MESEKKGTYPLLSNLPSTEHPGSGPRVGVTYPRRAVNPVNVFGWICSAMGTGVHEGKEVGGMRDLTLENVEGGYIGGGREGLLETFCLLVVIMRSAYCVPSCGPSTLHTFILFFALPPAS